MIGAPLDRDLGDERTESVERTEHLASTEYPEDGFLCYQDVQQALAGIGFDLDAAKRNNIEEKLRWGLVPPDLAEAERKRLEETRMSPRALQEIMRLIQGGKKFQLIFSFDGVARTDPYASTTEPWRNEFDRTACDFGSILGEGRAQYALDKKLLKNFGQPLRSGLYEDATIIFTPDDREIPDETRGKSPNEYCSDIEGEGGRITAAGIFLKPDIELLRPIEWLEFSMRSIDAGLCILYPDRAIDKMTAEPVDEADESPTYITFRRQVIRDDRRIDVYFPNIDTITLFPHWRLEPDVLRRERYEDHPFASSPCLGLKWEINHGKARIVVISCEPNKALVNAGPRRSFGRRRKSPSQYL